MAKNLIQRPLIFQDENLNVYLKSMISSIHFTCLSGRFDKLCSYSYMLIRLFFVEGVITGKSKSGKPEAVIKKGTAGLKSRNALNDITNKSTALPEEAAKEKSSHKEVKVPSELNIAEETFQHDHKKCVEAQRSAMTPKLFLELVLPGCGNFFLLVGCVFCRSPMNWFYLFRSSVY